MKDWHHSSWSQAGQVELALAVVEGVVQGNRATVGIPGNLLGVLDFLVIEEIGESDSSRVYNVHGLVAPPLSLSLMGHGDDHGSMYFRKHLVYKSLPKK